MSKHREYLFKLRKNKRLTQQKVADMANIERSYYSQIETGKRNPSVATAKKIAEALGFEWTVFFSDVNEISGQKVLSI